MLTWPDPKDGTNIIGDNELANIVYIAQSLDGYIAGPNGEIDWLEDIDNQGKSDFGYASFMKTIDALVMGRHTFEKVTSFDFWPYKKPVYVISKTLSKIPDHFRDSAKKNNPQNF
jgi:dihydrofolate reductase